MKIAFCTCVQLGKSCIEAALINGFEFKLLITLHDHKSVKKSGRIYLDSIAESKNVSLLKINHINDSIVLEKLKEFDIDWLFIIGWSQIANHRVLDAVNLGVIGAHPTLLPEGRGRASIPWAIIKGLKQTGVSFFKMDEGVDTGKIVAQVIIPINENDTASTLYTKVDKAHVDLFLSTMPKLISGKYELLEQDEEQATYWEGRTPIDGELKPEMTVEQVDRLVRATTHPYPGAFYINSNGEKVIVWSGSKTEGNLEFQCMDGIYIIKEFQIE